MGRTHRSEQGFTFVEVLAVVMLLGILIAVAMPQYFGAQGDARRNADLATMRAINSAVALFQFRNNGACPTALAIASFFADTIYFPDGPPNDPRTGTTTPYATTYSETLCRVQRTGGGVDHDTGGGH